MSGLLCLKLNCIVLGNNPHRIFLIDIELTESVGDLKEVINNKKRPDFDHVATDCLELWKMKTVSDLKNVIKVAKKPEFDHVAANHLELWKVKTNLNDIQSWNVIMDGGVKLHPLTELSNVFVDRIEHGSVDQQITYLKKGMGTPLTSAKPSAFSTKQDQQEYLYNCPRRAANPISITLLEPIFTEFMDDSQKYKLTVHDNDLVLQLLEKMASFYPNELTWMNTFWQVLQDYSIILNASMVGSTGYITDRHLLSTNGQFVLIIIEGKNESGSGAAKPFMEAMLYYQKFMEDLKIEIARLRSFIPCIHIIIFRACIGFSGSVFTEKVQTDVLVPIIPLFWHSTDLCMHAMAARTSRALKIAVEELTNLYSCPIPSLKPEDPYLKCPYPWNYTNFSNVAGSKICIKFVRNYSPQAHKFCTSKGNTPKLIAYNSLPGSWHLVIMDALDIDNDCLLQQPGSY
ncbi:hypothetical protein BDR06DRAFT_1005282 [Suillus hirtellus]|nr:hypothetical protein BDR06DRAFT_1005282 [Suillus hirtellus]